MCSCDFWCVRPNVLCPRQVCRKAAPLLPGCPGCRHHSCGASADNISGVHRISNN
uniref:Uncharacterized protein n=1 Tax=Arundo donax TaxID=35708 RepID=A0A0A9E1N9_ARUDO